MTDGGQHSLPRGEHTAHAERPAWQMPAGDGPQPDYRVMCARILHAFGWQKPFGPVEIQLLLTGAANLGDALPRDKAEGSSSQSDRAAAAP